MPQPKQTRRVRSPVPANPKAIPVKVKLLSVPPNASVLLDGKEQGRTNKKLELTPGTYTVILGSGSKERTFKIGVKAGASNKWCYDFTGDKVHNGSCPTP